MRKTLEERFTEKQDRSGGPMACWPWTGALDQNGYGAFWDGRSMRKAHRVIYETLVGPVPDGLQLDHLCRNRACTNTAHLEPVTARENSMRGETIAAANAAKTHCPVGHEYTPDNTMRSKLGKRQCRRCHREWHARKRASMRRAA